MSNKRNRTPSVHWLWSVFVLSWFIFKKRSQSAIVSEYNQKKPCYNLELESEVSSKKKMSLNERKEVSEYIVDETVLKAGSENIWLWVATEPEKGQFLAQIISKERTMFVAERFLSDIVRDYGKHAVSTDGGTWYPQACEFLKVEHHIHSSMEKSTIERKMQYIKDRTESFDDYFPCRLKHCKLKHVKNWLNLFISCYNKEVINA